MKPISIVAFFVGLIFASCNNNSVSTKGVNVKSVDSLFSEILKAKETEKNTESFKKVIILYWSMMSKSEKDLNYLCHLIEKEDLAEDDADWAQSLLLLKGWYAGVHAKNTESEKYLNQINTQNNEINLSKIQQLAFLKYASNQIDSSVILYNKGYQLAKDINDQKWMLNYANNLGSVYYDMWELELASKYFKEALGYAESLNVEVPMLINNVITVALSIDESKEALSLYEKYKDGFKSNIPYELSVYQLNEANILLGKGQIAEAEKLLNSINVKDMGENIEAIYDVRKAQLYLAKNDPFNFSRVFEPYKTRIKENIEFQLPFWRSLIKKAENKGFQMFTIADYVQMYESMQRQNKVKLSGELAEILFLMTKGTPEGRKWEILSLESKLAVSKANNLNLQNDMLLNFKLSTLSSENKRIKLKSELTQSQNAQYLIMFFCSLLVLLLIGALLMFYAKNRKIEVEKLKLEINNNRNLNELSKNKRLFADRLISSNQAMVKKINQIVKMIQKSSLSKEPDLVQIRKELIALTELEEDLEIEMNQLKVSDVLTFYIDKYSCIQTMNQTEKTILSYLLNGQKIKEIATLLTVSEQHVRNTKTRVLKLINSEMNSQFTIEDLIAQRNEISI